MKLKNFGFILVTFLSSASYARAGGMEGGGGQGVVCKSIDGEIKSVELLDLWEARTLFGRAIPTSQATVNDQVDTALKALKYSINLPTVLGSHWETENEPAAEVLLSVLRQEATLFLSANNLVVRLRGIELQRTDDAEEIAQPKNCSIEQLVTYQDFPGHPRININQDLVDQMDATNQAALIVHEVFYEFLRTTLMDANSIRARRSVGFVFSNQQFPSLGSILPNEELVCSGSGKDLAHSNFYMYRPANTSDGHSFSFIATILGGRTSIGYFPEEQTFESGIAEALYSGKSCRVSEKSGKTNVAFIRSGGPVDLEQIAGVIFECTNSGKVEVYLHPHLRGTEIVRKELRLKCRHIQK